MSKVYNYMIVAVGLTFLLKFAGIPSGADAFIAWMGLSSDPSQISLGTFFLAIAALFTLGTGTGIAISFFTRAPSETYVMAPIALGIFTVITSTFVSVLTYAATLSGALGQVVYYIIYLIIIAFLVSFGVAIVSFWRTGQ